ncbi:MAG: type II secretion system protein N [Enterobacteriaceae bacterium]
MLNKSFASFIEYIQCYPARMVNIITSLLAILLIYSLSHFAVTLYHIMGNRDNADQAATRVNMPHTGLAEIIQLNLLGQSNIKSTQAGLYCSDSNTLPDDDFLRKAPKAKLLARLAGVLYSSNPKDSIVIIEQGDDQTSYQLGDKLDNNQLEIVKIFPDSVIFREGNCYSMLTVD